ncbi:glucosamine 6-phosphate N-acetyltransferase [Daktulosphaira vitifoliae]|uniref:glucosamine 6-phosphate N-acetyltransferase n=1 Tax=Daktulosphaira vitifoliae TaxID=58002 RepID=UPI0021AAB508|nr:glucosamine 6-phosphate N-acetyltransferase [Daktulosphaira vitifoliae]
MEQENKEYLFNPELLSPKKGNLCNFLTNEKINEHKRYVIRPLCQDDYKIDYIKLLSQLTSTGNVSYEMFNDTFSKMKNSDGMYYIIVIHDLHCNRVVASGSLILERKFIHSCGQRARVEDIVVNSDYRSKGFGKTIVQKLVSLAKILKCYKVSLECKDKNVNWYTSFGFSKEPGNSNFMQIRFQEFDI